MRSITFNVLFAIFSLLAMPIYAQKKDSKATCTEGDECCKKPIEKATSKNKTSSIKTMKNDKIVACKLTSPELQQRKSEVIALLKGKVIERKELANGYQYTFKGSDQILDDLVSFIKSERACCGFFTFNLSVEDEESNVLLSIVGPKNAKEFIDKEMEL